MASMKKDGTISMNESKNPFAILGVKPESNLEAIKMAFREKAQKCHPDKFPGKANEFLEIRWAYEQLRTKEGIDRWRHKIKTTATDRDPSILAKPIWENWLNSKIGGDNGK